MSIERTRSTLLIPILATAAVGAGLVGILRAIEGSSGAWASLVSAGAGSIALIGGLAGLHWMISASAWSQVVGAVSGHRLGLPTSSAHLALTSLGKYVPGKIWGFGLRGLALRRRGVGLGSIAAASALEQGYLVLNGLAVAGLTLGTTVEGWERWPMLLGAVAIWVLMASGSERAWTGAGALLERLAPRFPLGPPPPRGWLGLRLTATFTAIWLALGGAFALLALTITDLDRTAPVVVALIGTLTVSYLSGFGALFVPAGLGVREGVGTALLAARGLPPEAALAAMVTFRLVTVLVELVAAGLSARWLVECVRG